MHRHSVAGARVPDGHYVFCIPLRPLHVLMFSAMLGHLSGEVSRFEQDARTHSTGSLWDPCAVGFNSHSGGSYAALEAFLAGWLGPPSLELVAGHPRRTQKNHTTHKLIPSWTASDTLQPS